MAMANACIMACPPRLHLTTALLFLLVFSTSHTGAAATDGPCELFKESDLQGLSEQHKRQVRDAEQRCREELERNQSKEINASTQMKAPTIEYQDPNTGRTQVFHNGQFRGEYSKPK